MTEARDDASAVTTPNPWQHLRQLTPARIALGRAGVSLPTQPQLAFQAAHAQARDAVHLPFDHAALRAQLDGQGIASVLLHSAARDRHEYLQRPDLGRRLDAASARQLGQAQAGGVDVALVVADGLSALAVHRHAAPLIARIAEDVRAQGWRMAPIVLVEQGRVAIADEVGERLGARLSVILIGERPGLSSPDSLGVYFTYAPKVGLTDAARNCVSNVRPEGLSYATAAHKLRYLMREAWRRQCSGVRLKEEAEVPVLGSARRNFLLD